MSVIFVCHNCGEHIDIQSIEKHVKEMHFYE